MIAATDYVRRETRISMVINAVLSLAFFALFFPPFDDVRIAGSGGFAPDLVPQSFAIALMSVLVPGLLTRRRLAAHAVEPLAGATRLPRSLVLRAIILALFAAVVGAVLAFAIDMVGTTGSLSWIAGAVGKIGYGILVAAVVTPIGLRAALASQPWHRIHRSR